MTNNPEDWRIIVTAMRNGDWSEAERLLIERDRRTEDVLSRFTYTPTLTQAGGMACTPPTGADAQVIRVDRLILFFYAPTFDFTDVSGSANSPEIYVSLPSSIAGYASSDFVGFSWFESSILEYKSGGVTLDSSNKRLQTFPSEAYQSPPITDLSDLLRIGVFASWWLPANKV